MAGNQVAYGANKFETGLSALSLRPCGPLALILVNGKKNEIGGEIRTESGCSAKPWVRRAVIIIKVAFW